mmetsp:Transcript_23580/g.74033  ORF Transcript_23580/g.74033 Transcript_23580/m.74033 type:complete len:203 (-) Transcript_23580:8510-9118(-)
MRVTRELPHDLAEAHELASEHPGGDRIYPAEALAKLIAVDVALDDAHGAGAEPHVVDGPRLQGGSNLKRLDLVNLLRRGGPLPRQEPRRGERVHGEPRYGAQCAPEPLQVIATRRKRVRAVPPVQKAQQLVGAALHVLPAAAVLRLADVRVDPALALVFDAARRRQHRVGRERLLQPEVAQHAQDGRSREAPRWEAILTEQR